MVGQESPAIRYRRMVHIILNLKFKKFFPVWRRYGYTYEDLVQEGLFAIIRAEPHYRPERSTEHTYYSNVVSNWYADRLCRVNFTYGTRRANYAALSLDASITTKSSKGEGRELRLVDTLRAKECIDVDGLCDRVVIENALRRLAKVSPRQAEAVRMRFFDDFDNYQIAAALGCTIQNASFLALKGIEALRKDAEVRMCRPDNLPQSVTRASLG